MSLSAIVVDDVVMLWETDVTSVPHDHLDCDCWQCKSF